MKHIILKNKKTHEKKELINKLWDIAENGNFRSYSEYRKEKGFS